MCDRNLELIIQVFSRTKLIDSSLLYSIALKETLGQHVELRHCSHSRFLENAQKHFIWLQFRNCGVFCVAGECVYVELFLKSFLPF